MKYLLALFLVALALQPLDVQACAMGADQQIVQHAEMHDAGDSECCGPDRGEPMNDCGQTTHCGFLSHGFLVIPIAATALLAAPDHHYDVLNGSRYSGLPAKPLFRPPIA